MELALLPLRSCPSMWSDSTTTSVKNNGIMLATDGKTRWTNIFKTLQIVMAWANDASYCKMQLQESAESLQSILQWTKHRGLAYSALLQHLKCVKEMNSEILARCGQCLAGKHSLISTPFARPRRSTAVIQEQRGTLNVAPKDCACCSNVWMVGNPATYRIGNPNFVHSPCSSKSADMHSHRATICNNKPSLRWKVWIRLDGRLAS